MKAPIIPFLSFISACCEAFVLPKYSGSLFSITSITRDNNGGRSHTISSHNNSNKPTQEWDVERYQNEHSFVWEFGASLVDILQAQPGERILDLGCGSGELTAQIAQHQQTNDAMGMDSDPSMVERAQAQFPQLHFFQGDIRSFQVPQPVDAIFSNAALHWVPPQDVDQSVQSISNALKVGGRLVVEFGAKGNVQSIVEAVQEVLPNAISPWYFPSISEYTTVLESHGIEVLQARIFDRPTPLVDTEDGIKNWLKMFGNSFLVGIDEEELEPLLDQIQDKLKPKLFDGTQWVADYRRIQIVGRKIA